MTKQSELDSQIKQLQEQLDILKKEQEVDRLKREIKSMENPYGCVYVGFNPIADALPCRIYNGEITFPVTIL